MTRLRKSCERNRYRKRDMFLEFPTGVNKNKLWKLTTNFTSVNFKKDIECSCSQNLKMPILRSKNRENTVNDWHVKDWHVKDWHVKNWNKTCQSLAKNCIWWKLSIFTWVDFFRIFLILISWKVREVHKSHHWNTRYWKIL